MDSISSFNRPQSTISICEKPPASAAKADAAASTASLTSRGGQHIADHDQMRTMLESALSLLRDDSKLESMTPVDIATTLQLVADQFVGSAGVAIRLNPSIS